jgi:hypothetical protein
MWTDGSSLFRNLLKLAFGVISLHVAEFGDLIPFLLEKFEMKWLFRGCIFALVIGSCLNAQAIWTLTTPTGHPTINSFADIEIEATGQGPPGGPFEVVAKTLRNGGGFNYSNGASGYYPVPGPPLYTTTKSITDKIEVSKFGNAWHQPGANYVMLFEKNQSNGQFIMVDGESITVS